MAKESMSSIEDANMKVNGRMIFMMDMVKKKITIIISKKVSGRKENNMVNVRI